ncbi:MAG: hypothetical protein J6Y20_12610 [Lachnospiraceae bacterium]|nr:hypothetical protein [Lachnospiraceae bacterium]
MEDMLNISNRVLLRANLAVLLVDDLTGLPITGSNARVWIAGQKPPVKKSDGWNAFLALPAGAYTVTAEGGMYMQTTAQVTIDKAVEVLLIRLSPNRLYRAPYDCIRVEGHAEPNADITVYSQGKQTVYKLQRDCAKKDTTLAIFHGGSASLQGRLLKLTAPDGKGETVRIDKASEDKPGEYTVTAPVENAYPKIGTALVPATQTKSEADGSFFALVKTGSGDSEIVVEVSGKKNVKKTFPRGEGNTITAVL